MTPLDFDLHGLAGIRVLDASPTDAAAVRRQLGPLERPLDRTPDLIVRFVDDLGVSNRLSLLGDAEAGWVDDGFFVLRSKHKTRARVRVPIDRLGPGCEITCEHGVAAVPLLIATINLIVLANGALPLHASAFEHDGVGVVVTGWSKGGKTEALLGFLTAGARYVGDEWVYLTADGREVCGIPEPIRVWDWHLAELPEARDRVHRRSRARLGLLRTVSAAAGRAAAGGRASRAAQRVGHAVDRQRHVDIPPEQLTGGLGSMRAGFDVLVHVVGSERADTTVVETDPIDVADRMLASLEYERLPLVAAHLEFRYAFPERRNVLLAETESRQQALLRGLFAGKPAYRVEHPHPASPVAMQEHLAPYLRAIR